MTSNRELCITEQKTNEISPNLSTEFILDFLAHWWVI